MHSILKVKFFLILFGSVIFSCDLYQEDGRNEETDRLAAQHQEILFLDILHNQWQVCVEEDKTLYSFYFETGTDRVSEGILNRQKYEDEQCQTAEVGDGGDAGELGACKLDEDAVSSRCSFDFSLERAIGENGFLANFRGRTSEGAEGFDITTDIYVIDKKSLRIRNIMRDIDNDRTGVLMLVDGDTGYLQADRSDIPSGPLGVPFAEDKIRQLEGGLYQSECSENNFSRELVVGEWDIDRGQLAAKFVWGTYDDTLCKFDENNNVREQTFWIEPIRIRSNENRNEVDITLHWQIEGDEDERALKTTVDLASFSSSLRLLNMDDYFTADTLPSDTLEPQDANSTALNNIVGAAENWNGYWVSGECHQDYNRNLWFKHALYVLDSRLSLIRVNYVRGPTQDSTTPDAEVCTDDGLKAYEELLDYVPVQVFTVEEDGETVNRLIPLWSDDNEVSYGVFRGTGADTRSENFRFLNCSQDDRPLTGENSDTQVAESAACITSINRYLGALEMSLASRCEGFVSDDDKLKICYTSRDRDDSSGGETIRDAFIQVTNFSSTTSTSRIGIVESITDALANW